MAQVKKPSIPLKEMVDSNENVYEITNVAIRRAAQITLTANDELIKGENKVVSQALSEVVHNIVQYKIE
jgi:DNA-directed RNA polymerase subunit K/omega